MTFNEEFFHPFSYSKSQIEKFFASARRDLEIAEKYDEESTIAYRFCYDAILKLGIALTAEQGYKVRSIPGHHMKILQQMTSI